MGEHTIRLETDFLYQAFVRVHRIRFAKNTLLAVYANTPQSYLSLLSAFFLFLDNPPIK